MLWGFLVALAVVLVLTPAVGGSRASSASSTSRTRSAASTCAPVPRLGGLAIFLGIFVPALAFIDLTPEFRGILLGAAVATTIGMVDDFRGLPWWLKLAGQFGAAGVAVQAGVTIDRFTFPIVGIHALPDWLGVILTLVWIVAIMNMVNFLDGLDGLAAGVCAISGITFAIISLSLGRPNAAVLSAIVAGACLGFLRHNFYPARIFMGDSGSLLLGFILATVAIQGTLKTAATVALFLPLFVLAVPIIDTSFVVARRIKHGARVFAPDQAHLHHRLLRRRLLAAADRRVPLGVVRDPRLRCARHPLRALPRERRVAPVADGARDRHRADRGRRLALPRDPARDPQDQAPARLGRQADRRGRRAPPEERVSDPRDETAAAAAFAYEQAGEYLAGLDERPVLPQGVDDAVGRFGGPFPEQGSGAVAALEELLTGLDAATGSSGPRFFHFVTGGVTPAALGADWLTTALDQNSFSWVGSPLGTRLETVALEWLKELFALPAEWGGALTTGATSANFMGLAAARQWWGEQHGRDIGSDGMAGLPAVPVLSSGFIHAERAQGAGHGRHRSLVGADVLARRRGAHRPRRRWSPRSAGSEAPPRSSSATRAT